MTTTEERPSFRLVECKPWCVWGDGHPGYCLHEDQWCGSEELLIDLSLEPEVEQDRGPLGRMGPDYYQVYAVCDPDEPVKFTISHGGASAPYITLDEVHQLIEALQLLVGQVAAS
ncbi:MAG: hypothetical protein M3O28_01100 [Actinomycetota bacterium]|nr:hypothetical protein [Actinomycetota bacterium]